MCAIAVASRFAIVPVCLTISGCGGDAAEPAREPTTDSLYEVVLTVSPLRMEDLVVISPLGSLNPPDHTIPNDHIILSYLDRCPCDFSPRPVFAPGSGTVRLVLRGQDDAIEIGAPPNVAGSELRPWYYVAHVVLFPDIQVGDRITAGQQIGVTGSHALGVDLGVVHPGTENFFVMRERYHTRTLFGAKPLGFFPDPIRSQLLARVRREGSDKDGRFDYDVAGQLTGAWFHESLPVDNRSTGPEGWSRNLAFVFWHEEPDVPVVSVGGTLLPPLVYWIHRDDPSFGDVGVASGPVRFRLYDARPDSASGAIADHVLLVQLVSATELRVEPFPGTSEPDTFTDRALMYRR